jgi:hypothetical protein
MDDGANPLDAETARASLPIAGRRDAWSYLFGEQARLKGAVPFRRLQLRADPAHRFHCWVTVQAVEPRAGPTRAWAGSR